MLEELLSEVAERGWLVNNLFQLSDGSWQANLRSGEFVTDFGRGPDPAEALSAALDALTFRVEAQAPPSFSIELPPQQIDLATLLGRRPINRRGL